MLLHLTSGRGPAECEFAVSRFLSVLSDELEIEILATCQGVFTGCLKSALIKTKTDEQTLCGTVQWICKSPFRSGQKRKNWFIGVNQIEEPKGCSYDLGNGGVVYQTFRSSGKGGQHVNKTESAVRAIHVATGCTVVASDECSQQQNKKIATERLFNLLKQYSGAQEAAGKEALFFNHNNVSRGNPVRTYQGTGFVKV